MDISGFFATVANNFRDKYLDLAQQYQSMRPTTITQPVETPTQVTPSAPVDEYQPSGEVPTDTGEVPTGTGEVPVKSDLPITGEPPVAAGEQPVSTGGTTNADAPTATDREDLSVPIDQKPDGTYYYQRQARLDYKLDLRFNLGAMTQTIEKIADGESGSIEQFAAAAFGLEAGFDIRGVQRVRTNMIDADDPTRRHELTKAKEHHTSEFRAQSRDFKVRSFYDEATRLHRNLNESARGNHRQAVNQFALRYRLDNQFSFSQLQRFNTQTEQVAGEMPDAVGDYAVSAGNVAANGSPDMMATFFDAVDGYLNDSEAAILDKVTAFFDQAAEELGFSGAMVEQARTQLTESIEGFFDRVDQAVAQLEAKFVPEASIPVIEPDIAPPLEPLDSSKLSLIDALLASDVEDPDLLRDQEALAALSAK